MHICTMKSIFRSVRSVTLRTVYFGIAYSVPTYVPTYYKLFRLIDFTCPLSTACNQRTVFYSPFSVRFQLRLQVVTAAIAIAIPVVIGSDSAHLVSTHAWSIQGRSSVGCLVIVYEASRYTNKSIVGGVQCV